MVALVNLEKAVVHDFTVDVEEYFQVLALEPHVPRGKWDAIPSRLELGVNLLLDLLSEHEALGTLFVLGWIAERRPEVVRAISERGHEIASHGSDHRRLGTLSKAEFRESVRSSKRALEGITGRSVVGYRAPNFVSLSRAPLGAMTSRGRRQRENRSRLRSIRSRA